MKFYLNYYITKIRLFLKNVSGNFITNSILGSKPQYENLYQKYLESENKMQKFINNSFSKDESCFINNLAKLTQVVIKTSPLNFNHGYVLFYNLKKYLLKKNYKNITIFETGTARGFSSIIMSKALKDAGIENYKIFTIDVIPHNKKIYWNCISDPIHGKVSRQELLKNYKDYTSDIKFLNGQSIDIVKKLNLNRINFAFLDGAHDYENVKYEFKYVKERQQPGDIIIFDDVTPGQFDGIVKLVNEIMHKNLYTIKLINFDNARQYAVAIKNK